MLDKVSISIEFILNTVRDKNFIQLTTCKEKTVFSLSCKISKNGFTVFLKKTPDLDMNPRQACA